MQIVGKAVPRKEGRDKVTGQARYIDDLHFPEMLYGTTVRSPVARGRIKNISFAGDIPWDEFVIVTAKDIPGENAVALILLDQPFLAGEFVNHPEEPVLLLAHPDKYLLEEARRNVHLEIESLPAIFTLDDSVSKKEIIWGEDNVFKSFHVEKGNVDEVWESAAFIVEGEYRTGAIRNSVARLRKSDPDIGTYPSKIGSSPAIQSETSYRLRIIGSNHTI